MNSVTGDNVHGNSNSIPSKGETLAEFQTREPVNFGKYQVKVLMTYVDSMHSAKFTQYVGKDVKNFDSRREALDSEQRLIPGQIKSITDTMINGVKQLEHYRSLDYIEPRYNPDNVKNEEAKEFVVAVMEEIASDIKQVEKHIERSSSAATNASQAIAHQEERP
ncbi:hypothetical protein [Endozoicomonas sp. ONNA1]|uniref:hypothetical protein n=1 Tax=Endozoicomonas sp. ONNA1 TaxID=2828740 RepID=UPI0021490D25|nr:hypothetical protein [Endozoicomonas sp. ONNA1]